MLTITIQAVTVFLMCYVSTVLSGNEWTQVQVLEPMSGNTNTPQYANDQAYQQPIYNQEAYQQEALDYQEPTTLSQYNSGVVYQQPAQYPIPQVYDNSIYQQDGAVYQQPQPVQYQGGPNAYDTQYQYNVQEVYQPAYEQQPVQQSLNTQSQEPFYEQQVPTNQEQIQYQSHTQPQNVPYENTNEEYRYQQFQYPIQPHDELLAQTPIKSRSDSVSTPSKFSSIISKLRQFLKTFFNSEGTSRSDSGFAAILSLSSLIIGSILYI